MFQLLSAGAMDKATYTEVVPLNSGLRHGYVTSVKINR